MIRSTHVHCYCRGADLQRFGHGPILVQINLQHSQAQPYAFVTHIKVGKQLVPFLKSLE